MARTKYFSAINIFVAYMAFSSDTLEFVPKATENQNIGAHTILCKPHLTGFLKSIKRRSYIIRLFRSPVKNPNLS